MNSTFAHHPLFVCAVAALCLLAGCAIQQAPTGGDKDTKPPALIRSSPANYSLNISPRIIEITFDELLVLKDASSEIMVSPLMPEAPQVSANKRLVKVMLPDSLNPNTTYTLNFGKAITDLHEGNALENFQFVFSTGSVLDSLKLSGNLVNGFNLKSEKGWMAALYRNGNDSSVFVSRPDYFALTDDGGNFTLKNISPGRYKLFGIKDLNANYKFDKGDELIGFVDGNIDLPTDSTFHIKMFQERDAQPRLKSARKEAAGKVVIILSAPANKLDLQTLSSKIGKDDLLVYKNTSLDTITIYYKDTIADSLKMILYNGPQLIDTVLLSIKKNKTEQARGIVRSLAIISNASDGYVELNDSLHLYFSNPLVNFNAAKLMLYKDSIAENFAGVTSIDSQQYQWKLNYAFAPKHHYYMIMLPGAAQDILDNKNDTLRFVWQTREERDYGSVVIKFEKAINFESNIVQLINENDVVAASKTIDKQSEAKFPYLLPGKYRIKVIADKNHNGKFDNGNLRDKIQPEDVFYMADEVQVRANWDVELQWK